MIKLEWERNKPKRQTINIKEDKNDTSLTTCWLTRQWPYTKFQNIEVDVKVTMKYQCTTLSTRFNVKDQSDFEYKSELTLNTKLVSNKLWIQKWIVCHAKYSTNGICIYNDYDYDCEVVMIIWIKLIQNFKNNYRETKALIYCNTHKIKSTHVSE